MNPLHAVKYKQVFALCTIPQYQDSGSFDDSPSQVRQEAGG